MPSASSRSVLARRARRLTRMLVGSRTWQTTPCAVSKRCSQKPSRPASKQQTTPIVASSPRAARACRDAIRANKAAVSPPSIRCRRGFSHPGTRAATSHVDALSSIARRIVDSSLRDVKEDDSNNEVAPSRGGEQIDDVLDGLVGAVVGGFESAVWAMLRVRTVVEAAVGKWSAQPFVEEQK